MAQAAWFQDQLQEETGTVVADVRVGHVIIAVAHIANIAVVVNILTQPLVADTVLCINTILDKQAVAHHAVIFC